MNFSSKWTETLVAIAEGKISADSDVVIKASDLYDIIESDALAREAVQIAKAGGSTLDETRIGYDGVTTEGRFIEAKGEMKNKAKGAILQGVGRFTCEMLYDKIDEFKTNPIFIDVALWDMHTIVSVIRFKSDHPTFIERLKENTGDVFEKRKDPTYKNSVVTFSATHYMDADLEVLFFNEDYRDDITKEKKSFFCKNLREIFKEHLK